LRLTNLVAQKASYTSLAEPVLSRITAETGETAIYSSYLSAKQAMMYAAKSDSPNSLRFRVDLNQPMPLAWGASGLAILAFLPREIQCNIFAQSGPAPHSHKRLSQKAFFDRIESVRRNGYAFSQGEKLPDSHGVAVPVLNASGEVAGSITLTIPSIRFEKTRLKEYAALLIHEAGQFSGRAK
jgi:DNA-binding IclR family transcriptional regulator